ncbi:hypothetical protein LTR84_006650 [Exophiala bonariae]|uniref:Fungal N-terminal domain-containing protein n=1 Tax=Exophiala bonariae TaxID=1690606 RepID=A0AAV9N424_9EURO|nr:hypothetical protein LTR84_006650 [Exophiala bonariae]
MSVVGISPSDFVAGGKAIAKATAALRDGGAKDSFQEADGSLQDRIAASVLLEQHFVTSQRGSPGSTALAETAKQLRERDQTFRKKHGKFSRSLGPQATGSRRKQVGSALKWAFKGEKDFEEHNNRVEAGTHATILNSILYAITLVRAHAGMLTVNRCASELSAGHHQESHNFLHKAKSGIEELQTKNSHISARLDNINDALTSRIGGLAKQVSGLSVAYHEDSRRLLGREHSGIEELEMNSSDLSVQLNRIDGALTSHFDTFADRIDDKISSSYGTLDENATCSQRTGASLIDITKTASDDQRCLIQPGVSNNNWKYQRVLTRLEHLEKQTMTRNSQMSNNCLPGEFVGAFFVLLCFCCHRYAMSVSNGWLEPMLMTKRDDVIRIFSQYLLDHA